MELHLIYIYTYNCERNQQISNVIIKEGHFANFEVLVLFQSLSNSKIMRCCNRQLFSIWCLIIIHTL